MPRSSFGVGSAQVLLHLLLLLLLPPLPPPLLPPLPPALLPPLPPPLSSGVQCCGPCGARLLAVACSCCSSRTGEVSVARQKAGAGALAVQASRRRAGGADRRILAQQSLGSFLCSQSSLCVFHWVQWKMLAGSACPDIFGTSRICGAPIQ